MGLREMQDMPYRLQLRGGGRHDNTPVESCPHCVEAQRELAKRVSTFAAQPRQNVGVVRYRNPWKRLWDATVPWLQVVAVWASIALVVSFGPRELERLSLWLAR